MAKTFSGILSIENKLLRRIIYVMGILPRVDLFRDISEKKMGLHFHIYWTSNKVLKQLFNYMCIHLSFQAFCIFEMR